MMRIRNLLVALVPILISVAAPDRAAGQVWNIAVPTPNKDYNQGSMIAGSGMATVAGAMAVFSFEQQVPFGVTGTWVIQGSENVTAVNMAGIPMWSKTIDPNVTALRILDKKWPLSQMGAVVRERDYRTQILGNGGSAITDKHTVLP